MVTTVIRIPENEYALYKELARERGVSLAEYFRTAARKDAKIEKKRRSRYSFWDLGTKFTIRGGPKDGSVNHDRYLYEFEESKLRKYSKKFKTTK